MVERNSIPDMPGAAILFVNRSSETITYCNASAESLLSESAASLCGTVWWQAIGLPSGQALVAALRAGIPAAVPPLLARPPQAGEMILGGYVFPQSQQGQETAVLLLFRLSSERDLPFLESLRPGDVAAVLGVIAQAGLQASEASDVIRRMIDARFGLQQIVPAPDDVGLPAGTTIPVALRSVTIEQARDICGALISHLSPLLGEGVRISVGLAPAGLRQSTLATLHAANNALLRLRRVATSELIAVAAEPDQSLPGAATTDADGVFSIAQSSFGERAFLAELAALPLDAPNADDYLAATVALVLKQPQVAAVAIYRRRFDDGYDFVTGGPSVDGTGPGANEKQLPKSLRQFAKNPDVRQLRELDHIGVETSGMAIFPLRLYDRLLGYLALQYVDAASGGEQRFVPGIATMQYMATAFSSLPDWRQAGAAASPLPAMAPPPVNDRIDGYVGDNMEGAIDQAVFLSRLDVPVAIIGPQGTGKLYVAKVIHQESGLAPDKMVVIDCREFRGRKDALNRIARELERSRGKTLVFKSPQLMNSDAQLKLARQISTRILADTSPPRYLPAARIIALFPDSIEHLLRYKGLNDKLASVFSASPIRVPPIKDRKRAVLRWAHKILGQEAARRDRKVTGFTPDAEQAMLQHDWPGNISEMRECICRALDKSEKPWLTPVDLGIFKGLVSASGSSLPQKRAYLQALVDPAPEEAGYLPTSLEELGVALGEALHALLATGGIKPLGAWLDDEVILAVCERYRDHMRAAADFLQTKPRNIGRWLPKVQSRDQERSSSSLWQTPHRLIRQWIREAAPMEKPPQQIVQDVLLAHVISQCEGLSVTERASIMGVSTPTYQKRLQEVLGQ